MHSSDDSFSFDPRHPPAQPPPNCADRLLWTVARALHDAHQARPDGFCECRDFWPCAYVELAEDALRAAADRTVPRQRNRSSNFGRWIA